MKLENEEFNLRDCIEDILDLFTAKAAKAGLDLLYQIDENVPVQIAGDSLMFCQVLTHLVGNAMKFTRDGEIFVGVHLLEPAPNGQPKLYVEIRDTGIGIACEKIEYLFKSFSQVDGLAGHGLAISEKLIKLMGGEIKVQSQPGKGSVFSFTIQICAGKKIVRISTACNMSDHAGKTILIVDDNATNREILRNQLQQWKLKPLLAASGHEALEILITNPAIDLVLTDAQMPSMGGIELARIITQQFADVPVILLSCVGEKHTDKSKELFSSILTKPLRQCMLSKNIISGLRPQHKCASGERNANAKLPFIFSGMYPLNILVADDKVANHEMMLHILNKLGYDPDFVEDGYEAVRSAGKKNYDLILMDVQMPRMDGIEASKIIRSTLEKQPVIIALTASAMEGKETECRSAGMDDYISKPFKLEVLVNKLEKWALYKMAV